MEKYIGQTFGQLKDRLLIYRPHMQQQEHQQIKVEKYVSIYRKGEVKGFLFSVEWYSNLLGVSYDRYEQV